MATRGGTSGAPESPGPSVVRSADELEQIRTSLTEHNARLRAEISTLDHDIADLTEDAVTATGDDSADSGTRAFERDQEMQVALNARELVEQNERALARLDAGTYGSCESCGQPIAKGRLTAVPGATLCVACKSKAERR